MNLTNLLPRLTKTYGRYLECGILAHGFARARCADCGHNFLVAYSCKCRGVCPSCTTRRMIETAAHLADHVIPRLPVRQWVLSVPKRLRYHLEHDPAVLNAALRIFLTAIERVLRQHSPGASAASHLGAVIFIHRFGALLNPHLHFHCIVVDGVFEADAQVYEERFERQYGFFRPYVSHVIYRYLDCGDLHNGFARVRCGDCGHEYLLAFSCKRRHFCPSCHQKRVVEFGAWLCGNVVKAVPHRHIVFSIPKILRRCFLYDRRRLTDLSRCGWESLKAYFTSCSRHSDAVPGAKKNGRKERNDYVAALPSCRPNTTKRITCGD